MGRLYVAKFVHIDIMGRDSRESDWRAAGQVSMELTIGERELWV